MSNKSNNSNKNNKRRPIVLGDKVVIVSDGSSHPHSSSTLTHGARIGTEGVVTLLHSWNGANLIKMGINTDNWVSEFDVRHSGREPKGRQGVFDLKKLDAVVLAPEVREEMEAVLKQHRHGNKLFREWGLGSVIEYGRGMSFLFYGPPGTGKTWATHCIARVFGKEVLSIGAAEIQTSEPGGANRNIQEAFASAKKDGKILLLDECDSLITNRSDVGMIIGGEINTLLTEIEKYEGVVVLATNRIETLDPALERRISLIVEFPEPNEKARASIWRKMLPAKMPVTKEVTPERLAQVKLTGGQIKNVVLQAARLALAAEAKMVNLGHFEAAVDRVLRSKSLMGSASRYHQEVVRGVSRGRDKDVDIGR